MAESNSFCKCSNSCECNIFFVILMKLKNRKKGLNYDNVIEECVEQLNWNEERTKNAIEIGQRQKWLEEIMLDGKLSYRLNFDDNANNEQVVVKDYVKNAVSQTDFIPTSDKEETLLVSVLQGQIRSLERQLDDKQRVIESLLNCQQNLVSGVSRVNVGQEKSCEIPASNRRDMSYMRRNNSYSFTRKANNERIPIKSNNAVNINDHK